MKKIEDSDFVPAPRERHVQTPADAARTVAAAAARISARRARDALPVRLESRRLVLRAPIRGDVPDLVRLADEGSDELADALVAVLLAAGAVEVGVEQLDAARVVAGVPSAGGEGGDGVLPQEAGLTSLISYRKGCYLGQEIMARIEARGTMRRGLRRLSLAQQPDGDRDIKADGRLVGKLGTAVRDEAGTWTALAVLRLDLTADTVLEVAGTTASVAD